MLLPILGSDHIEFIPFAKGEIFPGRRIVQSVDIAPTILDYLGVTIPEWMDGYSLLNNDLQNRRLIFSFHHPPNVVDDRVLSPVSPPYHIFRYVNIVDCHIWHWVDLETYSWSSGEFAGHTAPCAEDYLYSQGEIEAALKEKLSGAGFDISLLP